MSNISYKTKWQEADQQLTKLQADNARLRTEIGMMKDEIVRLNGLLADTPEVRHAVARRREDGIVGLAGIARHMRVARLTPQQWVQRGLLPPQDFPGMAGEPIWRVSTIIDKFVTPTRRVWYDEPDEELSPAA
jgi:hypothetical protein